MNSSKSSWDDSVSKWLDNFQGNDLSTAQLLVKQLDVHSSQKIQNTIRETLQKIIYNSHANEYFLLLPLVGIKKGKDLERKNSLTKPWDYGSSTHYPVAFGDYLPGIEKISIAPGSEGPVSHWVRNVFYNLEDKKHKILPSEKADFYFLSKRAEEGYKIRIICITDMSLSGNEAIGYGNTLSFSPIKKLFPKNVTVELFCYGISAKALDKIQQSKHFDRIYYKYFIRSLDEIKWIPFREYGSIKTLCSTLGGRKIDGKKKKDILGYENCGNLTITDAFIPNNTPLIFYPREDLQGLNFKWLFPNRYSVRPDRQILTDSEKLRRSLDYIYLGPEGSHYFEHAGTEEKRYDYIILNYLLKKKLQASHPLKGNPKVIEKYLSIYFSDLCIFTGADSYRIANRLIELHRHGLIRFDSNIYKTIEQTDVINQNPLIDLSSDINTSQDLPYARNKFIGNRKNKIHGFDKNNKFYYPIS